MYIKRVIIQGFKSYRDQISPEEFVRTHNIIVGRNGSGKSNFFSAIQFVLSDDFTHLSNTDRQNLLHEGTGPRVISAYVEIIFDNTDNRIPIEKSEVSLRRIIGNRKDQYFLDKKVVTKTDVMNLLESAGFSRSNPYYIVKQGKITQLATSPDPQRLKLLREVAGTKVYDERKDESNEILKDTEGKLEKIHELLRHIEERLKTLQSETTELKEYQKWDKERRALEYTIHNQELQETKRHLEQLQRKREKNSADVKQSRVEANSVSTEIARVEREVRETQQRVVQINDEKDQLRIDNEDLVQRKEQLQLIIADQGEQIQLDKNTKKKTMQELDKVKKRIEECEHQLEELKPRYEAARAQEEEIGNALSDHEHRRKELYAKQGRGNQFQSKQQRDDWIKQQMRVLNKALKDKENTITRLTQEIERDGERVGTLKSDIERYDAELAALKTDVDQDMEDIRVLRKAKDTLHADRQAVYREELTLQQQLNGLRDEMGRVESDMRSVIGKGIQNGIESVRSVVDSFREQNGDEDEVVRGYHGYLIELVDTVDTFYTCVEVTAGSRLFYHIVENDKIVLKILGEIDRRRLPGDINFMPLNRVEAHETHFQRTDDCLPMIEELRFDPRYRRAMLSIFGKVLICKSLELATRLAKQQNFDCVTIEGDQVSRKGTLTGGYYDLRKSRLELQKARKQIALSLAELEEKRDANAQRKEQLDREVNGRIGELEKKETARVKAENNYERRKTLLLRAREELRSVEDAAPSKEWKLTSLRHELEQMNSTKDSYQRELGTDLLSSLNVAEQREIDSLNDKIGAINKQAKEAYRKRMKLESEKNQLDTQLFHNLLRQKEKLEAQLDDVARNAMQARMRETQEEMAQLESSAERFFNHMSVLEERIGAQAGNLERLQEELEQLKQRERECNERLSDEQQFIDKMQAKQSALLLKKEECMTKIRDLGSLPADAFERFNDKNGKQLFRLLEKANAELKKYSHVNKKAYEQFQSFSDQKEKLLKRKDELDQAKQSISDLMMALDHRKTEAILFTYKQVSKYFQEIFKRLVPEGCAELVLHKGEDLSTEDSEEASQGGAAASSQRAQSKSIDQFTGIGIRISFTGKSADMKDMNQLSGGQKSLVALTLIFAIQKCDPAPFYLFDEIDAALDATHRRSVANMIRDLSSDAQFITTTFRPELLDASDKFYGVKFRNKVSHIECVTKEEALDFVEDDQTRG